MKVLKAGLIMIFLCGWFVFSEGQDIPEIKKDCAICHVSHKMGDKILLNAPLSELCLGCHPDRLAPNEHEVDVLPTMPVSNLPLQDGKMTCITCHDPHGKTGFPAMLRAKPSRICSYCHKM
ncbi:MAG: cytochrome c3 family protein [Nitrospirae bacterium]|nr:cytochrome c3 family protein [Nitrospirota bacterium]